MREDEESRRFHMNGVAGPQAVVGLAHHLPDIVPKDGSPWYCKVKKKVKSIALGRFVADIFGGFETQ